MSDMTFIVNKRATFIANNLLTNIEKSYSKQFREMDQLREPAKYLDSVGAKQFRDGDNYWFYMEKRYCFIY